MAATAPKPALRLATPEDAASLATIAREAYAPYVPEIGFEPPPMVQDFPDAIAKGRVHVIGNPPMGYVIAYATPEAWHIENVGVARAAQGQGLGRRLITAAEDMGRAAGHGTAALYTNAAMTANLGLYPHLGYTQTDRRTENGLDRVFFEKRL